MSDPNQWVDPNDMSNSSQADPNSGAGKVVKSVGKWIDDNLGNK